MLLTFIQILSTHQRVKPDKSNNPRSFVLRKNRSCVPMPGFLSQRIRTLWKFLPETWSNGCVFFRTDCTVSSCWSVQNILWTCRLPVNHNMIPIISFISKQDSSQKSIHYYAPIYTLFLSGVTNIFQDTSGFSVRAKYSLQIHCKPGLQISAENLGITLKYWRQQGELTQVTYWGHTYIRCHRTKFIRLGFVRPWFRKKVCNF